MTLAFKKAERKGIFARAAIDGPTGAGKTWTMLAIGTAIAKMLGKRMAVIDTERSSSDRYADVFDFDKLDLTTHSPDTYVEAINLVDPAIYGVLGVDSLSHAWIGRDGSLEQVDKAAARSQSNNKFTAWRDVTPMHNRLIDALLGVQLHLIVTMRSKMEYILEEDERGKKVPKKVGMAPQMRDGVEYEFDIVGDMDLENRLVITKTRASFLNRAVIVRPGAELASQILQWCGTVDPNDAIVTTTQLKELRDFGAENNKTVEEIQQLAQSEFGKAVREITAGELATLKTKIAALVTA